MLPNFAHLMFLPGCFDSFGQLSGTNKNHLKVRKKHVVNHPLVVINHQVEVEPHHQVAVNHQVEVAIFPIHQKLLSQNSNSTQRILKQDINDINQVIINLEELRSVLVDLQ